jgi:hypothetical protein
MQFTDFSEPFRCRRHLGRLCLRILLRLHCQRSLYHCGLCQRQVPGPRQIRVPGSARDRPAPHPRMVTTYARYRAPASPGKTGECRGSQQQPVETADGSGKNGAAADRLIDAGRLRPSEVIYRDNSPGQHESGGVQWSGPGPDSLNPDHIRRPPDAGPAGLGTHAGPGTVDLRMTETTEVPPVVRRHRRTLRPLGGGLPHRASLPSTRRRCPPTARSAVRLRSQARRLAAAGSAARILLNRAFRKT